MEQIFARHGLSVFDVEELPTHGGSLRLFACHSETAPPRSRACRRADAPRNARPGSTGSTAMPVSQAAVVEVKCRLLEFLIAARRQGKTVVGYGAPAKGNTY